MDNDYDTPQGRTPAPMKLLGILAIAALTLAVILLATGVFDFEQVGWFN